LHTYSQLLFVTIIKNSYQTTEDFKMSEHNYGRNIPQRIRTVRLQTASMI